MERWEREKQEYCNSLKEILLDTEKVDWFDLQYCVNVERVVIGKKVKKITTYAFKECPLIRTVELDGNKDFRIEGDCLIHNGDDELVLCWGEPHIPDFVTDVSFNCFVRPGTVPVFRIHAGVKSVFLSESNFGIGRLELDEDNPYFELESGCLFKKGGDEIIVGCAESVIPPRARRIGRSAFARVGFREFSVPGTVREIGDSAFFGCDKLENINIAEGVKRIEDDAFRLCSSLDNVALPDSVTALGELAFCRCGGLKNMVSFGGVRSIPRSCFRNCGFETLRVPGSIATLCESAFLACRELKELVLEDGVKNVGNDAFCLCTSLKKVVMAGSVEKLGEYAFDQCTALEEIEFSPNITNIPLRCFYECVFLKEVKLPERLATIDSWAFYNCKRLEKTNLGELKHLKKVIKDAFTGCRKLKDKGPAAKKKRPLPAVLYCFESFEEIKAQTEPGTKIVFLNANLSDTVATYRGAFVSGDKKYLSMEKADDKYFVEIGDELRPDALAGIYEVHYCRTIAADVAEFAALAKAQEEKI